MKINVGNVIIGGDYIPIQTMIKNHITDLDITIKKLNTLSKIGCDIVRVAVPDKKSIISLKELLKHSKIPIVADIHFDYRLAIMSIEAGVHKIRINPGNIKEKEKIRNIISCLKEYNIPVRIGINSGSLPQHLIDKYNNDTIKIMIESAKEEIGYFNEYGYDKIVLSFKSSSVIETININRLAKKKFNYPIHLGITEAGDILDGTIKNSIGISVLLNEKIGDTIRVSLTSTEKDEINVGKKILESIGIRKPDIEIISCPTCGRTAADIEKIVKQVKEKILNKKFKKHLKIAIMGCIVNGPGEAKNSDFGIACGEKKSIIFKDGKKIKVINNDFILEELIKITSEYYEK